MPDLTIEHNPDSGCRRCLGYPRVQAVGCKLSPGVRIETLHRYQVGEGYGAPDDCPLRDGSVTVRAPGGER